MIQIIFLFLVHLTLCHLDTSVFQPNICLINQQFKMIYFIRHAQSKFNKVATDLQHKYGGPEKSQASEQYLAQKFSYEYLDVEITEDGVAQCQEARKKMQEIDVDVILVSPMRRALRTCQIIFQNHKSKAPIIVEPSFRQIMQSSNDVGSKIEQSMQMFPHFDFSNIKDKESWYVHTLSFEKDKEDILKKLEGLQGEERKKTAIELTLQIMKQNWAERRNHLDKSEEIKKRILPDYVEQGRVFERYFKKYEKIAVVAHSQCIKLYAGYKIANCQIFPLPSQLLPNLKSQLAQK